MTRLKLPIGIQTFREIREDGCYYVDKTAFALRLIEYQLGWPNLEVYASLNDALLRRFTPPSGAVSIPSPGCLYDLLLANDFAGMETLFGALFAGIPNEWFSNNPIARYEVYYASVFYAYFASLGLDIVAEESSNAGRLDMAVRFNGQVYLFEFKVVELAGGRFDRPDRGLAGRDSHRAGNRTAFSDRRRL